MTEQSSILQCRTCRQYFDVSNVSAIHQPLCPACRNVGTGVDPAMIANSPLLTQQSSMALISMILGILCCISCLFPLAILAVTLGIVARGQIARNPQLTGNGLAVAGICLGIVGFLISIAMAAAVLIPPMLQTMR